MPVRRTESVVVDELGFWGCAAIAAVLIFIVAVVAGIGWIVHIL
jgi:hypothetical protein